MAGPRGGPTDAARIERGGWRWAIAAAGAGARAARAGPAAVKFDRGWSAGGSPRGCGRAGRGPWRGF
ncbi:hypothetical protein ISF6_0086 [Piscinibacter sakaiensis]|uniref:Uncharacterized protein n=1 Tax=Piscinibacter sakaiensis TaxID=1547922 RepID=A0A0K8NUM1_PISS1|nr:hypothetical protein ISF6_0086 [Piscinibacter sakaiensis]